MTTIKQVREVVQPLLARNADLALVGRLIVIKPVHHILRGVYIDRTSSADLFRPIWAVVFLFEPDGAFSFNWGGWLYRSKGLWTVDDPSIAAEMCDVIEQQALPLLRPVTTIDDFVAFTTKERFPSTYLSGYRSRKVFVDLARGDFASAEAICVYCKDELQADISRSPVARMPAWQVDLFTFIVATVYPLVVARDKAGIAQLLHDIESQSVRNEKLHKLWEPTPFPIEANIAG